MKKNQLFLWGMMIVLLAGCSKKEDEATTGIAFQLKIWASPVLSPLVVWTSGTANINSVKVQAKKNDNSDIEYNTRVDSLLSITAPVTSATVTVPATNYRQLQFKTVFVQYLTRTAMHLEGNYVANGSNTPVIFEVNAAFEVSAQKDSVNITPGVAYNALTGLDLSLITQGISDAELSSADRVNGVIFISANSNPGLFTKMLTNLALCTGVTLTP